MVNAGNASGSQGLFTMVGYKGEGEIALLNICQCLWKIKLKSSQFWWRRRLAFTLLYATFNLQWYTLLSTSILYSYLKIFFLRHKKQNRAWNARMYTWLTDVHDHYHVTFAVDSFWLLVYTSYFKLLLAAGIGLYSHPALKWFSHRVSWGCYHWIRIGDHPW